MIGDIQKSLSKQTKKLETLRTAQSGLEKEVEALKQNTEVIKDALLQATTTLGSLEKIIFWEV